MTLPELAIRRPVTTAMVLVSLAVLGTVALDRLPLAHLPEVEEPELFVRLPWPEASPEQVERMVIKPVEEALASVGNLREMWSRASDDGATIRLEFAWGTDPKLAQVEVLEKLDLVRRELPEDIEDISVGSHWNNREADSPVIEGRLSSKRDLSESYDLLERKIVRPLQRVAGVAQVRLDGVSPKEVRINLRLADLELHRMEVREVSRILRSSNFDRSIGRIHEGDSLYSLRVVGSFDDVEEIRNLPLRADSLRLRDVADVVYEEPELDFGRHLDGHFAIGFTVSAESKANAVTVCRELEERIAALNDDPELEGVSFLVWFSQGREIERTLAELFRTGIQGAILASIVLFAFLRRFSTTLIAVLCIPFALIVTCGVIWAQGKDMNTLSLLGLIVGVGMLVDNAVVVIENIFRHQELGLDRQRAALVGSREVSMAVIAATLTSVIVFLPTIFNDPSEMSIPLETIGLTVCLTLLASLFISQTLIPLATSRLIRVDARPRGRLMAWVERRFEGALALNLRHRWITPLVGVAIAASAYIPFQEIEVQFEAEETELFVEVNYRFSEESTLENKEKIVTFVESKIEPHRDELLCKSIYSWWSDHHSMSRIYLEDGMATPDNLALVRSRLRKLLPALPGVRLEVPESRQSWRRDTGKRISFQIFGEDSDVLAELATEARERLEGIEGLTDVYTSDHEGQQELWVELDRDLVSRYAISTPELAETVGLTFRGRRLPRYRAPGGEREMRLTLDERENESVAQLANLTVSTAENWRVPIASVASLSTRTGAEDIERENRQTRVRVRASYATGTKEDWVPVITDALSRMEFPHGYSWSFGDWQERQAEQSREFLVNLGLALLLIFALMASLFESVRQAIALMVALPFALAGAVWVLWAAGNDLDQPAAVGVLLLIGVVVNNGIVMIEHINAYRRSGMPREEAMLRGGRERLRPILMTALTTLIGLVPMIIEKPALGGMYYYSMAYVIMGGLTLSTLLTSLFLPTTVCLVEDGLAWVGRAVLWPVRAAGKLLPARRAAAR